MDTGKVEIDMLLHVSWRKELAAFLSLREWKQLKISVENEYKRSDVFPRREDVFKAFELTHFNNVKVVIIGQDPYHNQGQAMGLSFSVPNSMPLPPSLRNIYKEIESDTGVKKDFSKGDLTAWAKQGVLLLNALMTVDAHNPTSHKGVGWEDFTDTVISVLSERRERLIFILWGNFARSKKRFIDTKKHLLLEASHPSPFSAHSGFFGCHHFSLSNRFLKKHGEKEIEW